MANKAEKQRIYEKDKDGAILYSKGYLEIQPDGSIIKKGPNGESQFSEGGYVLQGPGIVDTNKTGGKEFSKGGKTRKK
jgi:hypothetical protein